MPRSEVDFCRCRRLTFIDRAVTKVFFLDCDGFPLIGQCPCNRRLFLVWSGRCWNSISYLRKLTESHGLDRPSRLNSHPYDEYESLINQLRLAREMRGDDFDVECIGAVVAARLRSWEGFNHTSGSVPVYSNYGLRKSSWRKSPGTGAD